MDLFHVRLGRKILDSTPKRRSDRLATPRELQQFLLDVAVLIVIRGGGTSWRLILLIAMDQFTKTLLNVSDTDSAAARDVVICAIALVQMVYERASRALPVDFLQDAIRTRAGFSRVAL